MQHLGHTLTSPVYITSQPVISESTLTESISSPILSVPNLNLIQSTSATLLPPTLTLSSSLFLFLQVRQAIETIDQAWMRQQQQQQLLLQQQSQQPQDDDSRGDSDDIVDIGGEGAEGGLSSSTRTLRSQTYHPPILIPPNKVPIHPLILRLPLHLLQLACAFNDDLLTHLLAFPLSSPLPLLLLCVYPQSVSFPGLGLDLGLATTSSEASHVVPGALSANNLLLSPSSLSHSLTRSLILPSPSLSFVLQPLSFLSPSSQPLSVYVTCRTALVKPNHITALQKGTGTRTVKGERKATMTRALTRTWVSVMVYHTL